MNKHNKYQGKIRKHKIQRHSKRHFLFFLFVYEFVYSLYIFFLVHFLFLIFLLIFISVSLFYYILCDQRVQGNRCFCDSCRRGRSNEHRSRSITHRRGRSRECNFFHSFFSSLFRKSKRWEGSREITAFLYLKNQKPIIKQQRSNRKKKSRNESNDKQKKKKKKEKKKKVTMKTHQ